MSEFKPENFGFEIYEPKGNGGASSLEGDYIRFTRQKNGVESTSILLSEDTRNLVNDLIGEKVGVGINERGVVVLFNPDGRSSTVAHRMIKQNKCSQRWGISCAGMSDVFKKYFGEFRRLPVDANIYANGEAIILKPLVDKIER